MNDDFVPYFCGGILFSLLIELYKDTAETLYGHKWAATKAIKQHELMRKLICVIKPNYIYNGNTLSKYTSYYRMCKKVAGDTIIPFENDSTKTEFDKSVKEQYEEVLERMTKFTSDCFPTRTDTAMRALVKKTLVLIRDDSSIENDTPFFINEDGSPISKENLLKKKDFCFQSFLIGTWHYIITKPTKNEIGKQTFEKLFPKCNGRTYRLDTSYLNPYKNDVNVTESNVSVMTSSKTNDEYKNIAAPKGTAKEETLEIKIYYKGGLLQSEDEEAILSNDHLIIDLNKNPNISIKDYPCSAIYKITAAFRFETLFLSFSEETVRLYCDIGSLNISGMTSIEKWISKSKLNEMRFRQKYPCSAWFRLTPYEDEYSAEFLLIGRIIE